MAWHDIRRYCSANLLACMILVGRLCWFVHRISLTRGSSITRQEL